MYALKTTLLASALLMLTGCATDISGTWQGRDSTLERAFNFGAVTFAPDGTYTAEAKYGDTIRAVSGTYSISGEMIMLYGEPFGERNYLPLKAASVAALRPATPDFYFELL